jgi:hypothetical protein
VNLRDFGEPLIPMDERSGLLTHNRSDGKRFVVRAEEMLTAFLELESEIRTGKRLLSGATPCQRMQQISCWKQRDTKNGAPKIDVMANAVLAAPVHRRKQVKCFKDMSQDYYDQASRAD